MSLTRAILAVGLAFLVAFVVLSWRSRQAAVAQGAAPAHRAGQVGSAPAGASPRAATSISAVSHGAAAQGAAPSLADEPFTGQELAMTSDTPDAPAVALRSSSRSGRDLSIELATREPVAEGKHVFATVSVSDGLGNTLMDCTWRDVDLTDDARKLECELPDNVELPLTISGHQRSAASFVETPTVVAIDNGVQR
jgi:hypothetical protein